jgi:hypothetical protein
VLPENPQLVAEEKLVLPVRPGVAQFENFFYDFANFQKALQVGGA